VIGRWLLPACAAALLFVALLTGCGTATIKMSFAVQLARRAVAGERPLPNSISCPGNIKAVKGNSVVCDLTYPDGHTATLTEHVVANNHIEVFARDLVAHHAAKVPGATIITH
jgi:hypothetical protein